MYISFLVLLLGTHSWLLFSEDEEFYFLRDIGKPAHHNALPSPQNTIIIQICTILRLDIPLCYQMIIV
jgi:hypothetical protein